MTTQISLMQTPNSGGVNQSLIPWPESPQQEIKIPSKLFDYSPAFWDGNEWTIEMAKEIFLSIKDSLKGCGPKIAAVLLDKILDRYGLPENWENQVDDYLIEISKIPCDLLEKINIYVRQNCKFFPKIPDLLESISNDIAKRNLRRMKVEFYISRFG